MRETPFAYQLDTYIRKQYVAANIQRYHVQGRVLEVGCGAGSICGYVYKVMPHLQIYAVDLDPGNLAAARRYYPAFCYTLADARELAFADGEMDAVILAEVIEHFPIATRAQALAEIRRVLQPGGLLVVTTPALEAASKPCVTHRDAAAETHHVDGLYASDLQRILEEAGFQVCRTETCLHRWAHHARNLISQVSYSVYDYYTQAEIVAHLEHSWLFRVYRCVVLPIALLLDRIPAPGYHHVLVSQKPGE